MGLIDILVLSLRCAGARVCRTYVVRLDSYEIAGVLVLCRLGRTCSTISCALALTLFSVSSMLVGVEGADISRPNGFR